VFEHDTVRVFPNPLTLDLGPGWTGVVGPNGAGKSTLLGLLDGSLTPDAGRVRVEARGASVCRVGQTTDWSDRSAEALVALSQNWSRRACRIVDTLALDTSLRGSVDDLERRWPSLSPGERQRWQLAAAMAMGPTILLCDEPTNHLDHEARTHLLAALRSFDGLGVLVSHDRGLLEGVCTRTLFIDPGGQVDLRDGAYDSASAARERDQAHLRDQACAARAEAERLRRRVIVARERQLSTQRSRSLGSRKRTHKDHDASSSARKARSAQAAASADASLRRSLSAHQRSQAVAATFEIRDRLGGALSVDWDSPRKRRLFSLTPEDFTRLAPGPWAQLPGGESALRIERDTHIELAGRNGTGKTTLLRMLRQRALEAGLPPERILFVPQDLDRDARLETLEQLRSRPAEVRARVLQIVARAGVDPSRLLASAAPSPGEARKLALALGLARRAWLLLLDEPTNHLDLPSLRAIEDMLCAYPGALVLVSHDRALSRACTRERWVLGGAG